MSPLAALPAALNDAQKAKGLVKAEVGLQHWNELLNNMVGCTAASGSSTCCQRQRTGPDAKDCTGGCLLGCWAASPEQACISAGCA